MTRLACFYNDLDPRARASLERYAPRAGLEVEWVDTSATMQTYARELEKRWTGEDDLVIVEHDKEIYGLTLPGLIPCDFLWCGYTYWIYPQPHTTLCLGGFGVTKFSAAIQKLVRVEEFAGEQQTGIDRRFYDLVREKHGIGCHLHGHVVHHHVYEPRPEAVRHHHALLVEQGLLPPPLAPAAPDPGLLPGSYRLPGR